MKATIKRGQFRTCAICVETVMEAYVVRRISICPKCAEELPEALEKAKKRKRTLFTAHN